MTVHVCGASGYVGSNLMFQFPDCVPVPRGTIPDAKAGDAIINLACYGHRPGQEDVDTMVSVNTLYPIRLWESLNAGVTMVQACSSSERDDPGTQYSKTKSIASKFLYGKATLAYIYTPFGGIYEPSHHFMTALIKAARYGGEFHVEQPNAMRDFLHVKHVCYGLMRLAREKPPLPEAHLGSGQAKFFDQVAIMTAKMARGNLTITRGEWKGKTLYPAPSPYVAADFTADLRREIQGC